MTHCAPASSCCSSNYSKHDRTFWTVPLHTKLAALAVLAVIGMFAMMALFVILAMIVPSHIH